MSTGRLLRLLLGAAALFLAGGAATAWASGGGHPVTDQQLWDFIYRCINFAILVGLLVVVVRKPLKQGLGSRVETIKEELADLESRRDAARREYAEMEARLKDASGEREVILSEFRAQGDREKQKIIDNAQVLAERIKQQAQFTIEQETSHAKAELRREVAELSAQVAEDLLKQNINQEDQSRLVDEYLAKVEQQEVQ